MKKAAVYTLFFAALATAAACNNENTTNAENMVDTMDARTETVVDNVKDAMNGNQDSEFVVKTTISNNEDMKLLQAGIDNGTNKDLKSHANMMLADHKKLGAEVTAYAATKGYILPTGDNGKAADHMDELNKKTKGAEWDKEWVKKMVDEHEDDLKHFEKEENNVKDAELKTIITNTLPILRAHLKMMTDMKDKMMK